MSPVSNTRVKWTQGALYFRADVALARRPASPVLFFFREVLGELGPSGHGCFLDVRLEGKPSHLNYAPGFGINRHASRITPR